MGIKLAEDAMAVIASWRSRSKSEKLKKKMSGSRSSSEPGRATHEHLSRGWSSISGGGKAGDEFWKKILEKTSARACGCEGICGWEVMKADMRRTARG
jgi:hypothetical protein